MASAELNPIHLCHTVAEQIVSRCLREQFHQAFELCHVITGMIKMWIVGGPEEAIIANIIDNIGQRSFVWIA